MATFQQVATTVNKNSIQMRNSALCSGSRLVCTPKRVQRTPNSRSKNFLVKSLFSRGEPDPKEDIYIGNGKYVKDDPAKYPDKELGGLVGGWARGESGYQDFRDEITPSVAEYKKTQKKKKSQVEKKVYINQETGDEVDIPMTKDFNGLVGGWPGGEKGVALFNSTGEVIENPAEATLGWGPPVLGTLLVSSLVVTSVINAPDMEEMEGVDTTKPAVAPAVTAPAASIPAPAPVAPAVVTPPAATVSAPVVTPPPTPVVPEPKPERVETPAAPRPAFVDKAVDSAKDAATSTATKTAPYALGAGVGVAGLYVGVTSLVRAIKSATAKVGGFVVKYGRVGLLAGVTGLVAASIFGLL